MEVNITNTKESQCKRCNKAIFVAETVNEMSNSHMCLECATKVFEIFNKYEWEVVLGDGFIVKTQSPVSKEEWFIVRDKFGFKAKDLNSTTFYGPENFYHCSPVKKSMSDVKQITDENNS